MTAGGHANDGLPLGRATAACNPRPPVDVVRFRRAFVTLPLRWLAPGAAALDRGAVGAGSATVRTRDYRRRADGSSDGGV